MVFESLRSLLPTPAVHAKPDVGGVNPEGHNRHGQQQAKREHQEEQAAHPVPNALGEITGKVIDTTA